MKHQWLDFLHHLFDDKTSQNNNQWNFLLIVLPSFTDRSNFVCTVLLLILFSLFILRWFFSSVLSSYFFSLSLSPNSVLVCIRIYIYIFCIFGGRPLLAIVSWTRNHNSHFYSQAILASTFFSMCLYFSQLNSSLSLKSHQVKVKQNNLTNVYILHSF